MLPDLGAGWGRAWGRAVCRFGGGPHPLHKAGWTRVPQGGYFLPCGVNSASAQWRRRASLRLLLSSLRGRRCWGSSRRSTATRTGSSRGARTMPRTLEPIPRADLLGPGAAARKAGTLVGAGRGQLRHASWRVRRLGSAFWLGVEPACTMRRLPAAWARICAAAVLSSRARSSASMGNHQNPRGCRDDRLVAARRDAAEPTVWPARGAAASKRTRMGGYRPE